jgi:hypothetical protein
MASFSHLNMLVVLGNKKALLVGSTVWRIVGWHDMIGRSGPVRLTFKGGWRGELLGTLQHSALRFVCQPVRFAGLLC